MTNRKDPTRFTYDAFISHSHIDKPAVRWLARFLTNFWVPLRRRRRLFVDHSALNAGKLSEHILHALKESRYLVVCNSISAVKSEWVNQEIAAFRNFHGENRILSVRIGRLDDDVLVEGLPQGSFIPDLRGVSEKPEKIVHAKYQ